MAINLASKYSDQIAEVVPPVRPSIKGKTAETYDLTGVKTPQGLQSDHRRRGRLRP